MAKRKKRKTSKRTSQRSYWISQSFEKVVFLIVFAIAFLLYPGQNNYTRANDEIGAPKLRDVPVYIPPPAPYPENTTGIYPGEDITATGVVMLDAASGVQLYAKNETLQLAPASTTKILTALTILDAFSLDDVVEVQRVEQEGQVMGLVVGERITIENLLYGLLIHSGNDAAYALADAYPGGREAFVAAMNTKATELHMQNSVFTNPAGFDDVGHKVTAQDLAWLAMAALSNKTVTKMVSIPQITVSDVTYSIYHPLTNVNQLLGTIPGVAGIKTGWTELAGESLVTRAKRGDHDIIIVLLHSQDRFGETVSLINWAFENHQWIDYSERLSAE